MSNAEISVAFFLQMAVIIAACRAAGWLVKTYLGQPQVVGEMIAGVILGPSLFGLLAPDLQAMIFPKETKSVLYVGAQLGIGLYMFMVGLGFRSDHFRSNVRSAAAVSFSGMIAPFLVAIALSPWLMHMGLFGKGVDAMQATLFLGAAISITAFPVLARIIQERGLARTPLGTMTLSAGAIDDACAWTVLALVLASMGGGSAVAVKAIVGGGLFAGLMLTMGPKLLAPLARMAEREGRVSPAVLGAVLVEPFALVVLVPMFFTFSGLNTQLTMVSSLSLLGVAVVILIGSILAKAVACWAAARVTGHDNPTAMGIGVLMNARGMMELIILNIGLQKGIIGPALFSMLVLMAIVTTLMTSPVFEWVYGRRARERGELGALEDDSEPETIGRTPAAAN